MPPLQPLGPAAAARPAQLLVFPCLTITPRFRSPRPPSSAFGGSGGEAGAAAGGERRLRSLRAPPGLAALRSWCRVGLGMPRALLDPALGLRPGLSRRASRLHGLPRPFQSLSRVSSLPELPGSLTRCLHSPGNGHSLFPNHGCLRPCASQELEGSHGPRSSSCLSHPDRAHTRCSGTELKPFW